MQLHQPVRGSKRVLGARRHGESQGFVGCRRRVKIAHGKNQMVNASARNLVVVRQYQQPYEALNQTALFKRRFDETRKERMRLERP